MKTERAENTEALQNGGLESSEKRSKKKRKNVGEVVDQPSPTETPTITVALPGSIINNTQSLELATRVIFFYSFKAYLFLYNLLMNSLFFGSNSCF